MRLILRFIALQRARLRWGRWAAVYECGRNKTVAAEGDHYAGFRGGLRGPRFTGNKPWGTGRTWSEAFRDADRWKEPGSPR